MPRRFTRFLLAVAISGLALPVPASAQVADDAVRVRLTGFSAWSAPDKPLAISLEIANGSTTPLEDLAVRLTIRERVRSRSALHVALDRAAQGDALAVTTEEVTTPLAPGETRQFVVERDLGTLATSFRAGSARSGVYPLTIRVQGGGRTIAERSGAFVFLAQAPETRLNVVWVMPLHRPFAADAQGAYSRSQLSDDLLAGGTLRRTVELLERHPAVAMTLAPTGLLPDQLLDISDGFDARDGRSGTVPVPASDPVAQAAGELLARLRNVVAAPAYQIATATYARADIVSLVAADMALDAGIQVSAGRRSVEQLLGRTPDPAVFAAGGFRADSRSASTFAALGARTLVLDPAVLRDRPEGRFGNPDRPEQIQASELSFDTLIVDASTRARIESPGDDPVLTAMAVLAETAVSYFEVPALAGGRTLVLATQTMPDPAVADPLIDTLSGAPWARVRTASEIVNDPELQPTGEPLRLNTAPLDRSERLTQARAARRLVDILDRVAEVDEATTELDRLVLAAESADFSRRPSPAITLARAARTRAEGILRQISVPFRRVTLTSNGGRVPITVVNGTRYPLRMRVRLDSPKVAFPRGATQQVEVAERQNKTVTIALEARATGSFPVSVVLETPDGQDVIGTGQVSVRSTAVSLVTFAATAGGVLFLVGAWARRTFAKRPKANPSG